MSKTVKLPNHILNILPHESPLFPLIPVVYIDRDIYEFLSDDWTPLNISVVIPVYNAQETLSRVLKSILPELLDGDQIIVADDRSDDDSAMIVNDIDRVEYVSSDHLSGAAGTRNAGASLAENEWILFVDSDAVPPEGWRKLLGDKMSLNYQGIQAIYGSDAPGNGAFTFYKNYYYHYTFAKRIRSECVQGCATFFFAVQRALFNDLGGFDEEMSGASVEDAEFAARLTGSGGRILLIPELQVYHLRQYSFTEFLRYEWMIMRAKVLLMIRNRKNQQKIQTVSMAQPKEMLVVLLSGILIWSIPIGLVLYILGKPFGLVAAGVGLLFVSVSHGFFWASMLRDGGVRGFRATAVTFPDLMLLLPAILSSFCQVLLKRK